MYSDNVCDDSLGVLHDLVQHFYEAIIDASIIDPSIIDPSIIDPSIIDPSIIDVVKACSHQSERAALSLHRNTFVKRKYLKRSNAT
jgi:hypothetical protein